MHVAGSAALELQHSEPQLLERINGYFGYPAVARLRLIQAPLALPRRAPATAPTPLDRAAQAEIEAVVQPVADDALRAALTVEPLYARIYGAARRHEIAGHTPDELADQAEARGIIRREERAAIAHSKALRREVIMVDDFPPDFGREGAQPARSMASAEAARRTA